MIKWSKKETLKRVRVRGSNYPEQPQVDVTITSTEGRSYYIEVTTLNGAALNLSCRARTMENAMRGAERLAAFAENFTTER